jgi:hypothetical protein
MIHGACHRASVTRLDLDHHGLTSLCDECRTELLAIPYLYSLARKGADLTPTINGQDLSVGRNSSRHSVLIKLITYSILSYKISNYGRLYSIKLGRILFPQFDMNGRLTVRLRVDEKQKMYFVYRLVAELWIPNPDNLPQVEHIDKDLKNNHVMNLRWSTALANVHHSLARKVAQIDLDGNVLQEWDCICDAAKSIGGRSSSISSCCAGRIKTYKEFMWTYVDSLDACEDIS